MKTLLLSSICMIISMMGFGQYCGTSGPQFCTPSGSLTEPFFTNSNDIPCITRGQNTTLNIEVKNIDTLTLGGQLVTVQSLKLDTIDNLPMGLCWRTNKTNNTFNNSEDGCLTISGSTNAAAGYYLIRIIATANIGVPVQIDMAAGNIKLILRVIEPGSICPFVDTNQTTPYQTFDGPLNNIAEVRGKVYYDLNQNNVFDAGDVGVSNQVLNISGNYTALTNSQGNYVSYLPAGNYSITPAANTQVQGSSYSPANINMGAITPGTLYAGNDFAVTIPPSTCLGNLSIVNPGIPPRPGFTNELRVSYKNMLSAAPVSQTIRLHYSPHQTFVSSIPAPVLLDTATQMAEWVISNLQAGSTWQAELVMQTPPPPGVALGTILQQSVSIHNSSCPSLDTLAVRNQVEVVGSYDPNDKAVSPIGFSDYHGIHPSTRLTYLVRFQNTGTFYAQDVVIIDTISPHLNLQSLHVLDASHSYEVEIENNRAVKFIFKNIMLPDSVNNEPESHGYIQFAISPNYPYTNNSLITNRADIYFDFNPPILTNTVYNTIDDKLTSVPTLTNTQRFILLPNPVGGNRIVTLITQEPSLHRQYNVYSITGKLLLSAAAEQQNTSVDVSLLAPGMYLLKSAAQVSKFVIE